MHLRIQDLNGDRGIITDGLELEYAGDWRADLETYLDQLRREDSAGEAPDESREVLQTLVIALPEEVPITEVEVGGIPEE